MMPWSRDAPGNHPRWKKYGADNGPDGALKNGAKLKGELHEKNQGQQAAEMVRGASLAIETGQSPPHGRGDGSLSRRFCYDDEVGKDAGSFSVRSTSVSQISHPLLRRRQGIHIETQG